MLVLLLGCLPALCGQGGGVYWLSADAHQGRVRLVDAHAAVKYAGPEMLMVRGMPSTSVL